MMTAQRDFAFCNAFHIDWAFFDERWFNIFRRFRSKLCFRKFVYILTRKNSTIIRFPEDLCRRDVDDKFTRIFNESTGIAMWTNAYCYGGGLGTDNSIPCQSDDVRCSLGI